MATKERKSGTMSGQQRDLDKRVGDGSKSGDQSRSQGGNLGGRRNLGEQGGNLGGNFPENDPSFGNMDEDKDRIGFKPNRAVQGSQEQGMDQDRWDRSGMQDDKQRGGNDRGSGI